MEYYSIWYAPSDRNGFMRFVGVRDSVAASKELIMAYVCQTPDVPYVSEFALWHYCDDQYVGTIHLLYDSDIDHISVVSAFHDSHPGQVYALKED